MGHMFYNAESFIALSGSLEMLDEISSIAYWTKLNFHKKSLGLLNIKDFHDGLLCVLNHTMENRFLPQVTHYTIMFSSIAD